jgi:hypothetical protein
VTFESDLEFEIANREDEALQTTAEIDSFILGHRRDVDHVDLMLVGGLYV